MRTRSTATALLSGATFVLVAGCTSSGGGSPKSSTPAESHASTSTGVVSGGFCSRFTGLQVGLVLSTTVTPGTDATGRCTFTSGGLAATVKELPSGADANGGYDAAKAAATSAVKGNERDVSGLGDKAFVVSGTSGKASIAEGAVQINGQVIEASISDPTGTPSSLGNELETLLRLAGTKV